MAGKKKLVLKKSRGKKSKETDIMESFNKMTKTDKTDMLMKSKSVAINSSFFILLISVVLAILFYGIIQYLNLLKYECPCFEEKNKENYSNLNYLIIIQYYFLFICIFSILGSLSTLIIASNMEGGKGMNIKLGKGLMYLNIVFAIILALVSGFFAYFTWKLYQNVDVKCDCSMSKLRYLIYLQGIFMIILFVKWIVRLFTDIKTIM